jgi:hypothetical protein
MHNFNAHLLVVESFIKIILADLKEFSNKGLG